MNVNQVGLGDMRISTNCRVNYRTLKAHFADSAVLHILGVDL